MANKYDNEDGVWRTIGGRRVFIRTGQSLSDAMKESGKFSRVAKNQDLYKKLEEENKKDQVKEEKKTIHTASGDYTFEEMQERDKEVKDLFKANWNNEISAKELNDKLDKMQEDGRLSYGERASLQYDASREFDKELDNQPKAEKNESKKDHTFEMNKEEKEKYEKVGNKIDNLTKEIEDKERLETAKEIAREIYGLNENNATPERIEREAKKILEPQEGEILEKGEQPYINRKGEIERSTESLKKWRDELKGTSEDNKPFVQTSTSPFYPDREYSKEELKKMEENGVRPTKNSYSGGGWEGVNSDKNLTTSEQAKEITDTMKKKYPDVKIARKSDVYSGGSSITFSVMSSDKDLYISDNDIDKMNYSDFDRLTSSLGFERWADDNVPNYKQEHTYNIDDVRRYAKEDLAQLKKRDNQSVRGDEWYLSDYGKKVMKDLNKTADSYTYDDSDAMTDYFNHGTYMWVNIGKWDKPYQVNESKDNQITNALKSKAYQNYKKQHPNTKMTFNEFKEMNKK